MASASRRAARWLTRLVEWLAPAPFRQEVRLLGQVRQELCQEPASLDRREAWLG